MATDLALHLQQLRVVDTHEHLLGETQWQRGSADVLADLFEHYPHKDLVSAGVSPETIHHLLYSGDTDIERRWREIEPAWQAIQFTGYGEAVRLIAQHVYGIEKITPAALCDAAPRLAALRQPGARHRFLSEVARYDHVQVNQFVFPDAPDAQAPEFFLYDLSWALPCSGRFPAEHFGPLGIAITDLASLRQATEAYFARHAPLAIAMKTQHAYDRTLRWESRTDAEAERALAAVLKDPQTTDESTRLCIGDWCLARGVEQAIRYNLPVKIHTGYYYNNDAMLTDRIRPGHLCPLFIQYPKARFVLMHAGYPYGHELPALAKHFTNVYVDLCWAWAMNPCTTMQFVRHYLHAAPITKLFAFGGDTHTPTGSYGYLLQMRGWLTQALSAEIADGYLTEPQAIAITTRILHDNAYACFDILARQAAMRAAASSEHNLQPALCS